jgi:hypothetical protein
MDALEGLLSLIAITLESGLRVSLKSAVKEISRLYITSV